MSIRHHLMMRRLRTVTGLLTVMFLLPELGSWGPGSAVYGAETGQKWVVAAAVAYGSKNNEEEGIRPLNGTLIDARKFTQFLGTPADHILKLYDEPDQPSSTLPTRANIVAGLTQMMRKAGPADSFWFYFSGHGTYDDGRSYLCPQDLTVGRRETYLAVGDIRKMLADNCKARIKVIVLDSCHSGSARRLENLGTHDVANDLAGAPDAQALAANIVTLAACQVGQCAWEVPGKGGIFTYYLMRGLNGDAAQGDGPVSLATLKQYVTTALDREIQEDKLDTPQQPVFIVPDSVHSLPLATRNADAIRRLDEMKSEGRPEKIEPLKPGLVLTIADENQQSTADTRLMTLRLRAALIKKGFPLVPDKEVQQFLGVLNDPAQDAKARERIQRMLSRFLIRGTLKKATEQDEIAGVSLISCRLTVDLEVLDATGDAKIPASVEARGTGRSVSSAENQAFNDAADQIMDQLNDGLSKVMQQQ